MTSTERRNFSPAQLRALSRDFDERASRRIRELKNVAGRQYVFRPQTMCRICLDEQSRTLVNKLLAHAMTYDAIVTCCAEINASRSKNRRITRDAVRHHHTNHFSIQEPAKAVIRQVLQERAEEHDKDWVAGVGGIVTIYSYLEVVVQKAFENLIDENTKVPVELGLQAVSKLHELKRRDADEAQVADLMSQLQRVITFVREHCTPEQQDQMRRALAGEETPALDVEYEADYDEDDGGELTPDPDFDGDDS